MAERLALLGGPPVRSRPFTRWPIFGAREHAELEDVLQSGSWGGFPSPNRKAREFAARFASFQGTRFAIPTSSGTTALEVALKALAIGPGDEVIVPAITFCATAYAAVACLARPVFADVLADSVCIDPESVTRLITPRTRAIVPVHYGATVADLDALTEIAGARAIAIVEDCAHVPGAQWRGRGVGGWGALGCFSFQSSKPMTAGEGGLIATDDPDLETRCQSLVNCGRRHPGESWETPMLGANYRMTEWQCAVLLAQLERMPSQIEHKAAMADRLTERLAKVRGVIPIKPDARVTRRVIYAYLFRIDAAAFGVSRNRFLRALQKEGVPCGVGNEPVYRSPLFPLDATPYRTACELADARPDAAFHCPVAERLFERELVAIPHECLLGDASDVDDIAAAIEKIAASAEELASAKSARPPEGNATTDEPR
jgi:dTDP-4-amino-4,6-dideoxygalactose transaminase